MWLTKLAERVKAEVSVGGKKLAAHEEADVGTPYDRP